MKGSRSAVHLLELLHNLRGTNDLFPELAHCWHNLELEAQTFPKPF